MKKDDDELEGMDAQEPIEGDAQDNANGAGAGAPDGDDGGDRRPIPPTRCLKIRNCN